MRRQADDRRRRIEIEQADEGRAHHRADRHQRSERNHLPVLVAHEHVLDVLEPQAGLRVGLHIDLEHPAELVELVDVGRSEIAPERGEHLVEGNLKRFGLHPVDLEPVLRNARAERRQHHLQGRLGLGIGNDRVGDALQLGHVEAAVAQLDLHGKAGVVADALDRRRRHHQDIGLRDGAESGVEVVEQRHQVFAFAALAPILEYDVGHAGAGQRRAVVQRRHSGDVDHTRDARRFARDLEHLIQCFLRALERGAVGQLHERDHVALILDRQKAGRHPREPVAGDGDERERHRRHQEAAGDHGSDQARIPALDLVIDAIEGAVENIATLRWHRRAQPHRALRRL